MATDEEIAESEETPPQFAPPFAWWKSATTPEGGYFVKILLAVYLNVSLVLWGMIVFDIASLNFGFLKWAFKLQVELEPTDPLILVMLAVAGGGLGGVIYGMDKLYKYSTSDKFKLIYAGDYVFRQFGAAALGGIVFALLASGLLPLNIASQEAAPTPMATQVTETLTPTEPAMTESPLAPEPAETQAPALTEAPAVVPPVPPASAVMEPALTAPPAETEPAAAAEPPATEAPVATEEPSTTEPAAEPALSPAQEGVSIAAAQPKKQDFPFSRKDGFFAFGLGFLSGFGSYQVTKKLDQVIKVIFGQLTSEDIRKPD